MKLFKSVTLFIFIVIGLGISGHVFAVGNIDGTFKYSQFLNIDLDNDSSNDQINWSPTNGGATVTDTAITGNIWGNTVGWINLNPTNGGVTNSCSGEVGGYAWGQNTGWINFSPTNGGVSISTSTGEFSGYAWSQNYGWINFDCGSADSCVKTSWAGCSVADICSNIAGDQTTVPNGYVLQGDQCVPVNSGGPGPQSYVCSNFIDDDNDGLTDYPLDPGCISAVDNSENNPVITPPDNPPIDPPPAQPVDPTTTPPTVPTSPSINPTNPATTPNTYPASNETPGTKVKSNVIKLITPVSIIIGALGLLSTIPGFATRLVNLIVAIPFYRKRRPWGIVYDSISKQTLDPVVVTVYDADTGIKFDEKITDINGRYGFLLPLGNYRITAQKTHYQFPTQKLAHTNSDGVYDNLYFGEDFQITNTNKSIITTLNIPMDKLQSDWNQEEKRRMGINNVKDFFLRNTRLWGRVSLILFIVGFVFSICSLIIVPNVWNTVVCAVYLVFTLLQLVGFGPVSEGEVVDASGNKIAGAVVRVWSAHLGTQIAQRITNDKGQYYLLVSRGDYYITVDRKNASDGFDRVYTSPTMKVRKGIVNRKIKI